jgi:hypothetical protein
LVQENGAQTTISLPVVPSSGDRLSFSGDGPFSTFTSLTFADLVLSSTGRTVGCGGQTCFIYNLDSGATGAPWKTYSNGDGLTADFTLTAGQWLRSRDQDLNYASFGDFRGTYQFSDGSSLPGFGTLNVTEGAGTDSFNMQQAAVPTPALLPGLIGMGVAFWRKKVSGEQNELETSEEL